MRNSPVCKDKQGCAALCVIGAWAGFFAFSDQIHRHPLNCQNMKCGSSSKKRDKPLCTKNGGHPWVKPVRNELKANKSVTLWKFSGMATVAVGRCTERGKKMLYSSEVGNISSPSGSGGFLEECCMFKCWVFLGRQLPQFSKGQSKSFYSHTLINFCNLHASLSSSLQFLSPVSFALSRYMALSLSLCIILGATLPPLFYPILS